MAVVEALPIGSCIALDWISRRLAFTAFGGASSPLSTVNGMDDESPCHALQLNNIRHRPDVWDAILTTLGAVGIPDGDFLFASAHRRPFFWAGKSASSEGGPEIGLIAQGSGGIIEDNRTRPEHHGAIDHLQR